MADTVLGVGALALLYAERGSAHTLGALGWLAVALAGVAGARVGWSGAGRVLAPEATPSRDNTAAVLFGLIVGSIALRYFGSAAGSPVVIWPTGMAFTAMAIASNARYARAHLRG